MKDLSRYSRRALDDRQAKKPAATHAAEGAFCAFVSVFSIMRKFSSGLEECLVIVRDEAEARALAAVMAPHLQYDARLVVVSGTNSDDSRIVAEYERSYQDRPIRLRAG